MSDGWSVATKDLIPSNGPVTHPDPRMHFRLSDLDPCTHRDPQLPRPLALSAYAGKAALHSQDYLTEPPRELSDRELLAVAARIAREQLKEQIDAACAQVLAELLRGRG